MILYVENPKKVDKKMKTLEVIIDYNAHLEHSS